MSNVRKEQRKDEDHVNISTTLTQSITTTAYDASQVQRDQQHYVNRAL